LATVILTSSALGPVICGVALGSGKPLVVSVGLVFVTGKHEEVKDEGLRTEVTVSAEVWFVVIV